MEKGFVYFLTNKNHSVIYVGATKNLKNRIDCHINGVGAVFTKKYNATILIYLKYLMILAMPLKGRNKLRIGIANGNGIL